MSIIDNKILTNFQPELVALPLPQVQGLNNSKIEDDNDMGPIINILDILDDKEVEQEQVTEEVKRIVPVDKIVEVLIHVPKLESREEVDEINESSGNTSTNTDTISPETTSLPTNNSNEKNNNNSLKLEILSGLIESENKNNQTGLDISAVNVSNKYINASTTSSTSVEVFSDFLDLEFIEKEQTTGNITENNILKLTTSSLDENGSESTTIERDQKQEQEAILQVDNLNLDIADNSESMIESNNSNESIINLVDIIKNSFDLPSSNLNQENISLRPEIFVFLGLRGLVL